MVVMAGIRLAFELKADIQEYSNTIPFYTSAPATVSRCGLRLSSFNSSLCSNRGTTYSTALNAKEGREPAHSRMIHSL